MGLGSDKNSIGLEEQTARAVHGLFKKLGTSSHDYDYAVFQQNLVSTPARWVATWASRRARSSPASTPAASATPARPARCWG